MGLVAGIGFALMYGVGVLISRGLRAWQRIPEPSAEAKRYAWIAFTLLVPPFILATSLLARYWQNEQRALLDLPAIANLGILTIMSVATIVFVVLLLVQKLIAWVIRRVQRWFAKLTFLPPHAGAIIAAVVALLIIVAATTGLVERTAVVAIDSSYRSANNYIDPAFPQPTTPLRSSGSGSYVGWQGLGREGRRFVSSGPHVSDISKFTHQPAKDPIRVYAGLDNADSRAAQINLVIRELERTGAFSRKMLVVTVPTGSGWVEAETVAALEYMHGGDIAVASAQYSYLPSGFAFLFDQHDATSMGSDLIHAVETKLQTLPADSRPKLAVYGLSLGSYGAQAAFSGESEFASKLDAGLFVGTPGFTEPWRTITRERDAGSPQIKPVYHDAKVIKFATSSADFIGDVNPAYKVVYYQYPTDPFVWFNAPLLYQEPDWMREAPGRGVSPHLHWFPVITFLQIAIDQIFALTIAGDNGHDYSQDTVAAAAAATKPADWSADKSRALQALISPPTTSK